MTNKEAIQNLREQGKSYNEIAKELNLAKSTVSYHLNFKKIAKRRQKIKYRRLPDGVKSILIKCQVCNKQKIKTKQDYEHSQGDFCSNSCSAIWNNQNNQNVIDARKQKQSFCLDCKTPVSPKQIRCGDCYKQTLKYDDEMTIADVKYDKHHKSAAFSVIRWRAKAAVKHLPEYQCCMNCKYSKTFEIAHIKRIADYPEDTKISVINSLDNLLCLCPNCHWEFDHGDLTLEQIKSY